MCFDSLVLGGVDGVVRAFCRAWRQFTPWSTICLTVRFFLATTSRKSRTRFGMTVSSHFARPDFSRR